MTRFFVQKEWSPKKYEMITSELIECFHLHEVWVAILGEIICSGARETIWFYDDDEHYYGTINGCMVKFAGCTLDILCRSGVRSTYGSDCGKFEVHLLNKEGRIIYPEGTEFEDDVLGYLELDEVIELIRQYKTYDAADIPTPMLA